MVEKKVQELKAATINKQKEQPYAKATETDWKHRYQSLTGGRYGSTQPNFYSDVGEEKRDEPSEREKRRRDPDDDRDRYLERRVEREEKYFKERKELLRERRRSPSPPVRRFTERKEEQGRRVKGESHSKKDLQK